MADHEFTRISCASCGDTFSVPVYCGDRFCPVCSLPRLARVRSRLQHLIRRVRQTRYLRTRFLTLTIQNQPDLEGMVAHLIRSFRKYRQTKHWKKAVKGGAFVIEVTGSPGNWHAHLHIVMLSDWMDFWTERPVWTSISKGRGWLCKIIPPERCASYLSKYLSKPDVVDCDQAAVSHVLSGYRLFQSFGDWLGGLKNYEKPERDCPKCGRHNYLPFDLLMRQLDYDKIPWSMYPPNLPEDST